MKNLYDDLLKEEYFHLGEMHCILDDAKDALKRMSHDGGDTFRTMFVRQIAMQVIEGIIESVDSIMHGGDEKAPETDIDQRLCNIWNEIHDLIEERTKNGAPKPVIEALEGARRSVDKAQNYLTDASILMEREASRA